MKRRWPCAGGHRHGPRGGRPGVTLLAAGEMGIGNTSPSSYRRRAHRRVG
ncbi:MAG: hypothetical protein ACLSAH_16705 [Bilophila wadsworthia]